MSVHKILGQPECLKQGGLPGFWNLLEIQGVKPVIVDSELCITHAAVIRQIIRLQCGTFIFQTISKTQPTLYVTNSYKSSKNDTGQM